MVGRIRGVADEVADEEAVWVRRARVSRPALRARAVQRREVVDEAFWVDTQECWVM